MYKNIVICLDGTGNEIETGETNILRLFRLLKNAPDQETTQRVYYHPGVGTLGNSGFKSVKKLQEIMGLAFGKGLEAEVLGAYAFICRHYRGKERDKYKNVTYEGDRIYLFGFSRGAYSVRVLAGFIHLFGLVDPSKLHLAAYAFRAYRQISDTAPTATRQQLYEEINRFDDVLAPRHAPIRFLGVFDTVASMLRFQPSKYSLIEYGQHPAVAVNGSVAKVRQALAIDEKRSMFRPYLWQEGQTHHPNRFKNGEGVPQDVVQMWFAGYHSDIGGSAPEEQAGLSKLTLQWMLEELCDAGGECELELRKGRYRALVQGEGSSRSKQPYCAPDYRAPSHDSMVSAWPVLEYFPKRSHLRSWFAAGKFPYYLPKSEPRVIPPDAKIHPSAVQRFEDDSLNWRPANLSRYFAVKKAP